MLNSLAHVEINVIDIKKTKKFYDIFLSLIGRKLSFINEDTLWYKAPDKTHIFFVKAEEKYAWYSFHRKNIWLNHFAFRVESKQQVDEIAEYLEKNNISLLYSHRSRDYSNDYTMEEYYAIFFEDPDRIKVEIVYCK